MEKRLRKVRELGNCFQGQRIKPPSALRAELARAAGCPVLRHCNVLERDPGAPPSACALPHQGLIKKAPKVCLGRAPGYRDGPILHVSKQKKHRTAAGPYTQYHHRGMRKRWDPERKPSGKGTQKQCCLQLEDGVGKPKTGEAACQTPKSHAF